LGNLGVDRKYSIAVDLMLVGCKLDSAVGYNYRLLEHDSETSVNFWTGCTIVNLSRNVVNGVN
jgi:hypothetical protein